MRFSITIIAAVAGLNYTTAAQAADVSIGVAAPLSGPSELLGKQVQAGANLAAKTLGAPLVAADDSCSSQGGTAAAEKFVAEHVTIAIGFLCTEAVEAALPILKNAGIPAITVGVRTESLTDRREKTGWPVFRLGPRGDDERNAAASILTGMWRNDLFAVIDDGTIYGREIGETVRAVAEQAALKPVFVDTFRPGMDNQIGLIGRLRKAGATHVFAGGDGADIAVMGRDAAQLGVDMVFAGGEAMRAAPGDVPYATGTLMIAPPEWADSADKPVLEAFASADIVPEGYTLPSYAAVQIAVAASEIAQRENKPLADVLSGRDFASAIGPIRFNDKGDLSQNPYRAFRFDGANFVPVEAD